jgi:hypothetical protein
MKRYTNLENRGQSGAENGLWERRKIEHYGTERDKLVDRKRGNTYREVTES